MVGPCASTHLRYLSAPHAQRSQHLEVTTRGILDVIVSNTRMEYPSTSIYTQQDSRGSKGVGDTIHGFAVVDKNTPATSWVPDPSQCYRLSTDPLCTRRTASTHRRSGIGICLMVAIDLDFSIRKWMLCNRKVGDIKACWSRRTQQVARSHLVCAACPAISLYTAPLAARLTTGVSEYVHSQAPVAIKLSKSGRGCSPQRILKSRRRNFAVRRNI
jgi:hypothetical protein